MNFVAASHSPFFRRTFDAWTRRAPGGLVIADRLADIVTRPVTADVIAGWVAEFEARAAGTAGPPDTVDADRTGRALRQARALLMMALIERDLAGRAVVEEVCAAMTAFAELSTRAAMRAAAAELAERHGRPLDASGQPQDLLVVGMGKCGGNELNVSSDLDVVFVFREEGETSGRLDTDGSVLERSKLSSTEFMHRLARRTVALLSEVTEEGFVFRVDTRLRPDGDSGPLVVPLSMLEQYFFGQGREWERFAWLKGRVIADSGLAGDDARRGDEDALTSIVRPFVFRRYLDFKAFAAMRDLHAMIQTEVGKKDARHEGSYDVKLGRGGIREIEFTAQLFQIVRGGRDPGLRDKGTLRTLQQLAQRRLLDEADVSMLESAYRLLRRTEHALQYLEDAQTHRLPGDPASRAAVAAMLGLDAATFESQLATATNAVQRVFDGLLHGNGNGNGTGDEAEAGATGGAGRAEGGGAASTSASGAPAPAGAAPGSLATVASGAAPSEGPTPATLERIESLKAGPRYRNARPETRQAIDKVLDGALAQRAGETAIARLGDLLEAVSGRGAYVALLAQYPQALARVLRMLGKAKWAADYLIRHPILLDELLDGQLMETADFAAWQTATEAALADATLPDGSADVERQMDILREAHHAQVFRLLAQDLEGRLRVETLSDLLSELADRVLDITIRLLWSQSRKRFREVPRFAAIAYGRLGGKELGYASDLDLVFVYDDDDDRAPEAYALLGQRISGWLSTRTAAGMLFEIDLRLRPNGSAGLLVSTLKSFADYQRESAWVWEHQALTRARFAAGDPQIGRRFEQVRREILVKPRDPATLRDEVVAMRKKMHDGHPNKSAQFDVKHDPGGMVDVEFIVQYLVLAHGARLPQLLDDAGNIALLGRAAQAGLIDPALAQRVADAYRRYRSIQHLLRLNDAQYVRVAPEEVAGERAAVVTLWDALLDGR